MATARSCFQRNSIAVLVSKLLFKILHVPPGDYISSSQMVSTSQNFSVLLKLILYVLYCKVMNLSGGTSVQDYVLVLHW